VDPPVFEANTFVLYAEKISTNLLIIASRALSKLELKAFSTARDDKYVAMATWSADAKTSAALVVVGTAIVITLIRRCPDVRSIDNNNTIARTVEDGSL
jgi:hypothetical protein